MHDSHFWKHFQHFSHDFAGERGRGGPFGGGRERGGRRGGWFGFGAGGPGGPDFFRGRKLSSTELQLVLLAMIGERPRHGYDLIKAVDEKSGGFYVPSPGVIYPALTYLEEAGDITAEAEGSRKLYTLTEAGKEHLAKKRPEVDEILAQLEAIGSRMGKVREAMNGVGETDDDLPEFPRGPWSGHAELGAALMEFHVAMKMSAKHRSAVAQTQLVAVIRRATAAIRAIAEADQDDER